MSGTELRKTGIGVVGDVPWGTHFFLFHETKDDLLDTLVPYFKAGLEAKELCMWVISGPLTENEIHHALEKDIPDLDAYLEDQSMQIVEGREWYMSGEDLDLQKVTRGWNQKIEFALTRGYAGLRLSADTAWLERRHWKEFSDYEGEVNRAIAEQPMIALCSYPLIGSAAAEILDVTRTHQFALVRRNGRWEVVETSELKQAKREIQRLNDELEHRVIERTQQLTVANQELKQQIAERQRAEEALSAARAELAHATRVTVMGEMAASIAHEVTQPLTGIVTNGNACLNWLRSTTPNMDRAQGAVERIIRDGERANEVIQEIRGLVKKNPPQKMLLDFNDVIRKTIALAAGEMARNQVQLETDLASDIPEITGDRVQLQQALLNLIVNAIEAMGPVKERPRRLLIRSTRQEQPFGVIVTVQDSGVGLDPHKQDRVFDAFFTTKPQGLGMGLSICRTIISSHGGRLSACSNADHGATFEFALPARTGEFELPQAPGNRAAAATV
jgi:C4-dicarboxylate-specific signal transduction histidine kinase